MINRLLNSKTKTISLAALILGASSFFSYILGAFRDNLLANILPNRLADVYWAAFRVPDFIYGILITGGITAAFLPVFAAHFRNNKESAQRLFKDVFMVFLLALALLSAAFFFLAPFLVHWTVPGFTLEQKEQTLRLMRIMLLSPVILGTSAIFSGALQYLNLFYAFALSPIVYNLGILFGILALYPLLGMSGLAWGVVFGGVMHLIVQFLPAFRVGFSPGFSWRLKERAGLWKIFKLMAPRVIGSAAYHINLIAITAIASTLAAGSIKIFNLSNNLYCLPVGLVGISFASAVFPALSRSFANNEKDKFLRVFSQNFKNIVFFMLPLSGFLFILRAQAVRLLYGTQFIGNGYFGWQETRLVASSLGILTASLFAASLIPLLSRAFFALHNTKKPVKIALYCIVLNVCASFFFVALLKNSALFQSWVIGLLKLKGLPDISVLGLALALSVSTIAQFFWLLFELKVELKNLQLIRLRKFFVQTFFASLLAIGAAYLTLHLANLFIPTYKVVGLLSQTFLAVFIGALIYFLACLLMRIEESKIIGRYFCRLFLHRNLR